MGATVLFTIFCIVFGVFWSFESLLSLLIALFICILYDMFEILKTFLFSCLYKITRRFNSRKLMEINSFKVLCLPTNTDFNLYLTETRLLRECDLALLKFWTENYVYAAVNSRKAELLPSGRYTCFRYPIRVFETFEIVTKVTFCDDKAFYITQSILRKADKCLCAVVLSVHQLVGTKMSTMLGNKSFILDKSELKTVAETFREFHSVYFKLIEDSWKGI